MERKEVYLIIDKIIDKAASYGLMYKDKLTLLMDIELAYDEFNLDLEALLNAGNMDFIHDVSGIQEHINRRKKTFENFFLPRFSRKKDES